MAKANGVKDVYLLVQYPHNPTRRALALAARVVGRVKPGSMRIIDLRQAFDVVRRADKAKYDGFFCGHMTREGNRFVAERIRKAMGSRDSEPGR